jgi:pimeloyl-ACP methyl ester carboxylesterase
MGRRALAILTLLAAVLACSSPVGIRHVDAREVHRTLTANVLTTGDPSVPTRQLVQRMNLGALFTRDPAAAIHEIQIAESTPDRIFALAELSFWLGKRNGDRSHYLAAAVYAWAYLFPAEGEPAPLPTDPRYRLACDLYNRGLTEGIDPKRLEARDFSSDRVPLPFGVVQIAFDQEELEWSGWRLGDFVPAAYLEVRGLRNRYRVPGIGAPLVASLVEPIEASWAERRRAYIPAGLRVPTTALLRFENVHTKLPSGELTARLELIPQDEARFVEIEGRQLPVEFEISSALASTLEGPPIWWTEIRGFLFGGVLPQLIPAPQDQIQFLQPYLRGRIPIVLVHGTASSGERWAELVNELQSDPLIQDHYQVWIYRYDSGNPVGFSAGGFREALAATVRRLDPGERDAALQQMVVIGHSQGGLLAKLTAIDSDDHFWRYVSHKPFEEMDFTPGQREVLERSIFFTPLPFVTRLIYIATPHGGSYLTLRRASRWVASLVELPNGLTQLTYDAIARNRDDLLIRQLDGKSTAIDNMTPGNPFLETLRALDTVPGVSAHSIIAVQGDGPVEEGADGVVRYSSAHLPNVESELVVRSGHSCQAHPATIEEVRRILHVHAGGPRGESTRKPIESQAERLETLVDPQADSLEAPAVP